jgi:hypothetical protein
VIRFALPRSALHLLAGVAIVASAACARTATFRVTHPAMVNAAAVGNTMSVAGFSHNGAHAMEAEEIRGNLAARISNSLNRSIQFMPAGGGITITGAILANDYVENFSRSSRTCTRSVYTTNSSGQRVSTTQSYPCTDLIRRGRSVAQIQFRILSTATGQVMFDRVYERALDRSTTGIESAYESRMPDPIDFRRMLFDLRGELVDQFSRVILPWQEDAQVVFEDCAGDQRCTDGFELAKTGNLPAAEQAFNAVVGDFNSAAAPVPNEQAERIGEALYNRGLVRGYQGRYAQAVTDISRALQLRPGNRRWAEELENIQLLARDEEALRQQGAIANETQNVEQAGTP